LRKASPFFVSIRVDIEYNFNLTFKLIH